MRPKHIIAWGVFWSILLSLGLEVFFATGGFFRFASIESYLLFGPVDSWTHNQILLHKLRTSERTRTSTASRYFFLGGSVGLEAIHSDEDILQKLGNLDDNGTEFISLNSSLKTLGDETKIVDALKGVKGTLIIPIEALLMVKTSTAQINARSAGRLTRKYTGLPISDEVTKIINEHGGKIDFIDRSFLLRNTYSLGHALRGILKRSTSGNPKTTYKRHAVGGMLPEGEESIRRHRLWMPKSLEKYDQFAPMNWKLLSYIAKERKRQAQSVVLVDVPINPILQDLLAPYEERYIRDLKAFVERHGVTYWNFHKELNLPPEDFKDVHHLLPSGREKFGKLIAEKISQLQKSEAIQP